MRIEHWDVAFNQGKTAALNMLGKDVAHEEVPYFFSVLADWGELEYVGPAYEWDQEIVRGSIADAEFSNWYLKDGVVKAALSFGRSDDLEDARGCWSTGACSTRASARRSAIPTWISRAWRARSESDEPPVNLASARRSCPRPLQRRRSQPPL